MKTNEIRGVIINLAGGRSWWVFQCSTDGDTYGISGREEGGQKDEVKLEDERARARLRPGAGGRIWAE